MQTCDTRNVHALVDGQLAPEAAQSLRLHLGSCVGCKTALEQALLLDVLGEGFGVPARPVVVSATAVPAPPAGAASAHPGGTLGPVRAAVVARMHWVRRILMFTPAVALAAGLALWLLPAHHDAGAAAVFAALTARPRNHDWRLAYPGADRHRRYDGPRAGSGRDAPALLDLSAIEQSGDAWALAAAQLLAGMPGQAEAHLRRLADDPDVLNDRAAALLARGALDQAKGLLDRVLAHRPRHAQAQWNKALLLERQGDAAGAARLFRAVAQLGEPGWAAEATARAGGGPL